VEILENINILGGTCAYNFNSCKALVPTQNDKESEAKLNVGN